MYRLDVKKAVEAIESVLPKRRPIGHHEPYTNDREAFHVNAHLEKGITNYDYTQWFEEKLCFATGADQAIVVSNGSAALHLALVATGVKPGEEVLVPSLTYAATPNAVVHAGAIPNFIDGTLCLNPFKLERYLERETLPNETGKGRVNKTTGRPVTALIMVHLLGWPCAVPEIRKLTDRYGLVLIEDAAEALGSTADNRPCGGLGDASVLSFNHNKVVTTGGGGALLSNEPYVIAKAYHLAHQSRLNHPWSIDHDSIGWNYAMPPVCAALGVAQLEKLQEIIGRKSLVHSNYRATLADVAGAKVLTPTSSTNFWMTTVLVDYPEDRDILLQALHDKAIQARALFKPMHMLPFYEDNPKDSMGYANNTFARAVCLPSGAGLL